MGLSKEGGKVKDAWNDIGKEAFDGAVDDVMCGLDLKSEKTWPSTGLASRIPKPYYTKLSSVKDGNEKGVIVIDSFTKYELRKYIESLTGEGFEKYSDAEPMVYVHNENGIAVCPVYDESKEKLELLYAVDFAAMTLLIKETYRQA